LVRRGAFRKEHLALEIVLADGMHQNNDNECHPCVG
jgi:hypothetical protein